MTQDELRQRIVAGPKTHLAFDTNAVWSFPRLKRLLEAVNRLNFVLSPTSVEIWVPTLVYAERILQLRHELAGEFREHIVTSGMLNSGLQLAHFDEQSAQGFATQVYTAYPVREDWHIARRQRFAQFFHEDAEIQLVPGTVDWFIAGQVGHRADWILVTDDTGVEWRVATRRVTLQIAEKVVETLTPTN